MPSLLVALDPFTVVYHGVEMMVYRVLRVPVRALLGVFYRRIEVAGLEHVPPTGPLLVVANHHNALIDPMLLVATIPRRLVPVAKAPLFRHPLIGPFLLLIGALRAHRREDAASDPGAEPPDKARNAALFTDAIAALRRDRAILIFPEGVSQPEPTVMPLRTGAARMVLGAEAESGGTLGVIVLPVGLVYHQPATFRAGRALVIVGKPVPTNDLVGRSATEPGQVVRALTDRMAAALHGLIVEAEDRQTLHLLHVAEALWREESGRQRSDAVTESEWLRRLLRGRAYLAAREPGRVDAFRDELERYARDLERAGLTERTVQRTYPASVVIRYALREGLALALALPLAILGIVQHLIPYQLTALVVRLLRPDPDTVATYKIAAGILLYPLCWIGEAWLTWRFGGRGLLAVFFATLLPSGFFALAWQQRLARVRRDTRGFLRFLANRDLHERLLVRRRSLRDELDALAALVPESVLAGRQP